MSKNRNLFSALLVPAIAMCLMALPGNSVAATTKSKTSGTTATAPVTQPTTTPTTDTTTAPAAAAPAPSTPARPKIIDAENITTSGFSKGTIDVYMTLNNTGKRDDALSGAETTISDQVDLVTVKDDKETVAPLHVDLPNGQEIKLTSKDQFLRISNIQQTLKDGDKFQLLLHFRSAPNTTVDVTVHKKSGILGF